ncbi:MAG TPA: ROK family protein, partial [Rhizomicrobium sp.]|nr:ROK family protein [Rhizomicrobium sp.]
VCVGGRVLTGAHAIGGEWGHNPLPAPQGDEEINNAPLCYCGKHGCIESWCSGPGLARDFRNHTGRDLASADIAKAAASGDKAAIEAMQRFYDRFARAIASVVNILDPDVIVIGGGLSNIDALYTELPPRVEHYAFTPEEPTRIVKNVHGDSSGVRGAAWLWHIDEVKNGLPA